MVPIPPAAASGYARAMTGTDWAVLAGYFVLIATTGVLFARRASSGTRDYFLAGRSMPGWAVAISLLATAQSAATFIGGPQHSYRGSLVYLSTNIGGLLGAMIVVIWFVPAFYRAQVATPYQLLERRFGHGAVLATSWAYVIGRVLASGSRVFIAAIPVALIAFGDNDPIPPLHLLLGVWVLVGVGVGYTLAGGIRSVIWTDVIQAVVYIGGTLAVAVLLFSRLTVPLPELFDLLKTAGPDGSSKLTVVDVRGSLDRSQSMTLLTACTGFTLLFVASYGTDNDMVQRLLTCKDKRQCARTALGGTLVGIPVVLLFLAVGLLLYLYYNHPATMGNQTANSPPQDDRQVFLSYILTESPRGLTGLLMAGLFAAGLSSVNSTLNAMSASFVNDIYRPWRSGRDDTHYLRVGRAGVIIAGLLLGGFATVCIWVYDPNKTTLIDFALSVMVFAYAGLLGVFATVLFTRRGNTASIVGSLIAGFVTVLLMQPWFWDLIPGDDLRTIDSVRTTVGTIAWPWQLVVGSVVATAVCMTGSCADPIPAPEDPATARQPDG